MRTIFLFAASWLGAGVAFAQGSAFSFGAQTVDTRALDAALSDQGVDGFAEEDDAKSQFATVGLKFFSSDVLAYNVELQYLTPKTSQGDVYTTTIQGGYATFGFGPAIKPNGSFLAAPGVDFGMGALDMTFRRSSSLSENLPTGEAKSENEDQLDETRRVHSRFFVVGGHLDALWGEGNGGVVGGLRAGYLYTPDYAAWSANDGGPIGDLPRMGIRGGYVALVIGGGKI